MSEGAYLEYESFRYEDRAESARLDNLLIERPLAITINSQPWTLSMQTPGHEIELAAGLSFTEGVIKRSAIVADAFATDDNSHITTINISVPEEMIVLNEMRKRTLLSLSSCGVCGRTELPKISATAFGSCEFDTSIIPDLMLRMHSSQLLFHKTGGCHAAAAYTRDGDLMNCFEDIGRHNAVDKVIGRMLLDGNLNGAKVMTVSSRVSYEIVVKCFAASIPVIIAVSAPSSLAVDMAKEFGMNLYGFCRDGRYTRYA